MPTGSRTSIVTQSSPNPNISKSLCMFVVKKLKYLKSPNIAKFKKILSVNINLLIFSLLRNGGG